MWSVDEWDETADFIVMDDVPFQFIASRKQFWGCQREFIVTDKYRAKRKIGGGKPLIYLGNDEEDFEVARDFKTDKLVLGRLEVEWYRANTVSVPIVNKMYIENYIAHLPWVALRAPTGPCGRHG